MIPSFSFSRNFRSYRLVGGDADDVQAGLGQVALASVKSTACVVQPGVSAAG